jgi:hypothetical protein
MKIGRMATVNLRLRGLTLRQGVMGVLSALPLLLVAYEVWGRNARPPGALLLSTWIVVALTPWLSLALARVSCRARCDEVAVHVRGEALPYKTITDVSVVRTARRTILKLRRGDTVELQLILWDAFAGRLQPYDDLARRLAAHGHPIPTM